jgi:Na+-transporting methylmalonyl-CoA/oxaloacetate decarboxylase gamma subunit
MENLLWGLQTTLLGMGLVFGLLALMWGLLTLTLRLDQPVESPPPAAVPLPPQAPGVDGETVAAILVATLTHRAQRRREAAPAMRSYWPGSLLYASRWVGAGRARQNHGWRRGYR